MGDLQVPEAEWRALVEAIEAEITTRRMGAPALSAVYEVAQAAADLVSAGAVAAVRADQQGPTLTTDLPARLWAAAKSPEAFDLPGLLTDAADWISAHFSVAPICGDHDPHARHVIGAFSYTHGAMCEGVAAAPSGADQQEPAMDWYCVAAEAGLPFDHCSPENPMHSAPCGPWDRSPAAAAPSTPGAPE